MSFVFVPPAFTSVPVVGEAARFPVHRIYCVGRNYVEHAKEMGGTGRDLAMTAYTWPPNPSAG